MVILVGLALVAPQWLVWPCWRWVVAVWRWVAVWWPDR
jgi:hypothetical protein